MNKELEFTVSPEFNAVEILPNNQLRLSGVVRDEDNSETSLEVICPLPKPKGRWVEKCRHAKKLIIMDL